MAAVNFVKFERGLKTLFERRRLAGTLDENTLYFVYNTQNAPEEGGELWLGSRLIGGTGTSSVSSLNDLTDIDLSDYDSENPLIDGMLLHYEVESQTWKPISIVTALENAGFTPGGSGSGEGGGRVITGSRNDGESINAALGRIVSNPAQGDIAVISGEPYAYTGSRWVSLTSQGVLDRVDSLETDVSSLQSQIEAIRTDILSNNHLSYQVLGPDEGLEDLDTTVGTINSTVFLVPNNSEDLSNQYDEYMYVNSNFEKLGSWSVNLDDYVKTEDIGDLVSNEMQSIVNDLSSNYVLLSKFNNEVGDISILRNKVNDNDTTIVEELADIYDRLTWNDIVSD